MQQPLDIVIAWVDGNDVELQQKRLSYIGQNQVKTEATRFASNNEIYYNIASILKYVPYVRHIYVVTDQQKPLWLDEFEQQGLAKKDQIKIIDHQVLFSGYRQYLPTFNSLSIEMMLWNIPDISPYFLYLNDDFFFNAPSTVEDFIIDDQVKIYGHWQSSKTLKMKFKWRDWLNKTLKKTPKAKYTIAQMLSADVVGLDRYFEIHHRPHVLVQQVLSTFFKEHPQLLIEQISPRFRSFYQLLPVGLSNHLCIQNQHAILLPDVQIAYLKNAEGIEAFKQALQQADIPYGCVQSLDQFTAQQTQQVMDALNAKFKDYLPLSLLGQE
ncbi:Stealth CR1 domain-containing protein [Acinetobacter variabilis]|uniref:Stealth CR1 domain-containing protein n=1 Tax=Acinetobacter variabilis TaxID=70346 RepID=UPI0028998E08|nr:Stealth CR1 domain-containing protein [Acinetobacter variabilis]